MNILSDDYIKRTNNIQHHTNISNQNKINNSSLQKITEYNPPYYKPISFGSSGFENYFPERILGISEQEFDNMILNSIKIQSKRDKLTEYITELTSKDRMTMNFINMWKKQIPSLVSQGIINSMTGESSQVIQSFLTNSSRNYTNSAFQKFLASDYQKEILYKDAKSAGAGVIAYNLFSLANADPEPHTKIGLYGASLVVGTVGYAQRSKDSQDIQNKQYIAAVKEMIKIGVLDPYTLVQHIDKTKTNLSTEKQEEYNKWIQNRKKEINYQKTGLTVDTKNDFDTPEAQNALKVLILALKRMNMKDEEVADFLQFYGTVYDSVKGTQEAETLTRMSLKIYQEILQNKNYASDNPQVRQDLKAKICSTKENLAYLCEKNQKYNDADDYYFDAIFSKDPLQKFRSVINYYDMKKRLNEKYHSLKPMLDEDQKISKTEKRKKAFEELNNSSKYQYYSEKINAIDSESFNSTFYSEMVENDIKYPEYKNLAMQVSKLPIKDVNFNPERFYKRYYKIEYSTDGDWDKKEEQMMDNLNNAYKLSIKLEQDVRRGEMSTLPVHEKARYILGANILIDNLKDLIKDIYMKPVEKCDIIDAEIMKICADNIFTTKNPEEEVMFLYENGDPEYLGMYQKQLDIISHLYGDNSREFYEVLGNMTLKDYDSHRIGHRLIPRMQFAPYDVQADLVPKMTARYAKMKATEIMKLDKFYATEKQALDVIVPYVKYFENTEKIDDKIMMEFLQALDQIYSDKPMSPEEYEYNFDKRPRHVTSMYFTEDAPMYESICRYGNEEYYNKFHPYLNWDSVEDKINEWVQKSPGIYRVNERKFLDLKKKYETVIFQNSHNRKMDSKMIDIENKVNLPQML